MPKHLILFLLCLIGTASAYGQNESAQTIDFAKQILPILSDRCFTCHGPDQGQREADLRLDLEDHAKEFSIVEGDPSDSELIDRIDSDDPDYMMPPPASNLPPLTPEQVKTFRQWISEGAKWDQHWAFVPPKQSNIPGEGLFSTSENRWIRNPIDAFVLKSLKSAKVRPSRQATRETLIRRITFDLTGLPPTLEEIEQFQNEPNFDVALERLVNRLLASPHYGQRMASDWLDIARYSDTYGYQVDRDRRVWPWRDWVIKSFNQNKPYDEFITEQIAGDMLANATDEQVLATTFNRLHPQKVEGGSVEEEFRIEYVADRTQTFATAFLGLTMECCRCHDHKYDPISQKEYYQLSAFFDNIDEAGLYSFFTNSTPTPTLDLPNETLQKETTAARNEVERLEKELHDYQFSRDTQTRFQSWLNSKEAATSLAPVLHEPFNEPDSKQSGANQFVPGIKGSAIQLSGDDPHATNVGNFARHQPFSVSLWIKSPDVKKRAVIFHRSRAWTDAASRGYQLLLEEGKLSWSLIHFWPGNAIRIRTTEPIPINQWQHVAVTYDGSSRADGLEIYLNGRAVATAVVRDDLSRDIKGGGGDHIAIGQRFRDYGFSNGLVDEFRVYDDRLTPREIYGLWETDAQEIDAKKLDVKLTEPAPEKQLTDFLLRHDVDFRDRLSKLMVSRAKLYELQNRSQQIMVMRELPKPRTTYLLNRGAYNQPTEKVQPLTPGILGSFEGKFPDNRLGLAQWLVRPENPLTARVFVNRVWQSLMGEGLVRTPEDFGVQGQAPTHPELLDWLATDFVRHGWDVKRLVNQIVNSSTYLQSSSHRVELIDLDPENRLLARGPRHRLSAEMLRDNVLFSSGLLSEKVGGPPSKPYEVAVSFKPTKPDSGEGLYRRSLYTYWKRTGPAPVMMTLDASKRDVCRVKRERTSSPLQAFVLMNSPQFVEAARALSGRLIEKHGDDQEAIVSEMFVILTGRIPSVEESRILEDLFEDQVQHFTEHPDRSTQYLSVGESPIPESIPPATLAAWTVVANALFGHDDVVMKK